MWGCSSSTSAIMVTQTPLCKCVSMCVYVFACIHECTLVCAFFLCLCACLCASFGKHLAFHRRLAILWFLHHFCANDLYAIVHLDRGSQYFTIWKYGLLLGKAQWTVLPMQSWPWLHFHSFTSVRENGISKEKSQIRVLEKDIMSNASGKGRWKSQIFCLICVGVLSVNHHTLCMFVALGIYTHSHWGIEFYLLMYCTDSCLTVGCWMAHSFKCMDELPGLHDQEMPWLTVASSCIGWCTVPVSLRTWEGSTG